MIARDRFQRFAATRGLQLRDEFGFADLPRAQRKLTELLSLLSLRTLASTHVDLCYVLQRLPAVEEPLPTAAVPAALLAGQAAAQGRVGLR